MSWPARAVSENTAATASSTPATSRTGASSASHAPSANRGATWAAARNPSRVLPTPPAPVSVTTRARPSAATVCSSSRSRPMNELTGTGRFPGRSATVRIGGNPAGRPAWVS